MSLTHIVRLKVRAALAGAALAALPAQTASAQSFVALPKRLPAVGRSVVTTDDSLALLVNPANLSHMPAGELRWRGVLLQKNASVPWQGNALTLGLPLPFGLAVGAGFDMALPPSELLGLPTEDYQWLTLAASFGNPDSASIGFSWQRSYSSNPGYDAFSGFTIGLNYRPWDALGVAFVAEDLNTPTSSSGARLNPFLHFAAAVRPTGTQELELTVDGVYQANVNEWGPQAMLSVGVPFGKLSATGAWLANPGGDREWLVTAGTSLNVSFARSSIQTEAHALLGDAVSPETLDGGYASVGFRSFRSTPSVDLSYARRIRIESTPGARSHVALLRQLWSLAEDPSCNAVVLEVRSPPAASLARAEELRDAIRLLQQRGKPVLCHMESAGGNALFVCSQAKQVLINPAGGVQFAGLSARYLYFKSLLDKLGIRAEFIRIGKHKSAPERFTRTGPTETAKRNSIELLHQFETGLVDGIAKGRGLPPAQVRTSLIEGPYVASEAEAVGFVNGTAFDDQLGQRLNKLVGHRVKLVDSRLAPKEPATFGMGRSIAIVHVDGDMVDGRSRTVPFLGMRFSGSYTIAETLERLRGNPSVGAVVLRVDTPGGSAMAADVIWRQVERLAGAKPVIVSMGSVAASAGYYISAPATEIYANPLSITGSIGIFYGKADIQGLMNTIGVDVTVYKTGPRADAQSIFRPYTESERHVLRQKVQQFYDLFVGRVAKGRDLSVAQVDAVAQGRVWTGSQALNKGLVDHLGGLRQAMDKARALAGLDEHAPVVQLPVLRSSLIGRLLGVEGLNTDSPLPAQMLGLVQALVPFAVHAGDKPLARLEIAEIEP